MWFPQWQGAASCAKLPDGSLALRRQLWDIKFQELSIKPFYFLSNQSGVYGLNDLQKQFKLAQTAIYRAQPKKIFTLGGDCGIELAPIRHLHHLYGGRLGVIWLDAHADMNTPASSPSGHFHGMVLAALMGLGTSPLSKYTPVLGPEQVILAGPRDLDASERLLIHQHHIAWLSVEQLTQNPAILLEYIKSLQLKYLYLHVDLDVLDPEEFASVSVPTKSGLTKDQLMSFLSTLHEQYTIVGGSVTEFTGQRPEEVSIAGDIFKVMCGKLVLTPMA